MIFEILLWFILYVYLFLQLFFHSMDIFFYNSLILYPIVSAFTGNKPRFSDFRLKAAAEVVEKFRKRNVHPKDQVLIVDNQKRFIGKHFRYLVP